MAVCLHPIFNFAYVVAKKAFRKLGFIKTDQNCWM